MAQMGGGMPGGMPDMGDMEDDDEEIDSDDEGSNVLKYCNKHSWDKPIYCAFSIVIMGPLPEGDTWFYWDAWPNYITPTPVSNLGHEKQTPI